MKIGITERGDASRDLSWISKTNNLDAVVLITKNVTDQFIDEALNIKDKAIIHATITGWGGTIYEPNLENYLYVLDQVDMLRDKGFSANKIVIRIDPIFPTEEGIARAKQVLDESIYRGYNRFRVSILDMYPHVRKRFEDNNLDIPISRFQATESQIDLVSGLLLEYKDSVIECCAEPKLKNVVHRGCVSEYDLDILGIDHKELEIGSNQRRDCMCLSCKTELLTTKHPCMNNCLYCYWKREGE